MFVINSSGESETDSLMSEDDTAGKKEEMKKSIFMKRKSNDNLSLSPRGHEDTKKKSEPKCWRNSRHERDSFIEAAMGVARMRL